MNRSTILFRNAVGAIALLVVSTHATAQSPIGKPALTPAVYNTWETVEAPTISDDGKYVTYKVHRGAAFQGVDENDLFIKSADLRWQKNYKNFNGNYDFSGDSKSMIIYANNKISILNLGSSAESVIENVKNMKVAGNRLIYLLDDAAHSLVIRDLGSTATTSLPGVRNFYVSESNHTMVLEKEQGTDIALAIFNLDDKSGAKTIWTGKGVGKITFDENDKQLVFEVNEGEGEGAVKKIWLYKKGSEQAVKVYDGGNLDNLKLASYENFSKNGGRLFLTFTEKLPPAREDAVHLNIWTYKDRLTQVEENRRMEPRTFTAVLDLTTGKVLRLQKEDDGPIWVNGVNDDTWVVTGQSYNAPGLLYKSEMYLINTKDGSRKPVDAYGTISPDGKYMVHYNFYGKEFESLEIATGIKRTISKGIATNWFDYEPGYQGAPYPRGLIAGWIKGDAGVLVYDMNDIWQLDMAGKKAPINITNGYGKKYNNMFFLLDESYMKSPLAGNEELILTSLNTKTKDNGFFKIKLGKKQDPELLTMGPYAWSLSRNPSVPNEAHGEPRKAKNANVYLVHRESATESPNFYVTSDFKKFTQVSDVYPEKQYNWYTTSLHEWVTPDGITSQGILYKPENFDPNKKYPVIFYYYSYLSDNLNVCLKPEPSDGQLNIPLYVSNGYLVFTPDIHHPEFGNVFKGCLNSLVSAAEYVAKLPFVDAKKMGMQGISWGGIQTNYYVTHTNLFAAACSASGLGNFLSQYNGMDHSQFSQSGYESGIQGSGKTIWETPQWYLDNSPVMSADKATTPFLMFETTNDGACPFMNAFELYNGMRRLGKKVWMLEYTDADHGVWGKDALDFDIRMMQFFDHYLKNAPPPKWMTEGRPARLKSIDDKLALDNSGKKV